MTRSDIAALAMKEWLIDNSADAFVRLAQRAFDAGREAPTGWRLVPVDPTYAMAAAAYLAWDGFGEPESLGPIELCAIYKNLLAASPPPP